MAHTHPSRPEDTTDRQASRGAPCGSRVGWPPVTRWAGACQRGVDSLEVVRAALDARDSPVTLFFRDDDAGWRTDRLRALLDLFAEFALPVDLAVKIGRASCRERV